MNVEELKKYQETLEKEYEAPVMLTNCQRMGEDSFYELFEKILFVRVV